VVPVDIEELARTVKVRIEAAQQALNFDDSLGLAAVWLSGDEKTFSITLDVVERVVMRTAETWRVPPILVLAIALNELTDLANYSGLE
jgi:hypothetical protein